MSTRYIWEQYQVNFEENGKLYGYRVEAYDIKFPIPVCSDYKVGGTYGVNLPSFEAAGNISSLQENGVASAYTYPYILVGRVSPAWPNRYYTVAFNENRAAGDTWMPCEASIDGFSGICLKNNGETKKLCTIRYIPTQGSKVGFKSSEDQERYPDNDAKEDYWYKYVGSDNIDPNSISYSTSQPAQGQPITVTVSPRSTSYGTISYLYQYSTNGGASWTDAGSATTATSKIITVPSSATQFKVRVRAQDNLGFTSTTYVTGSNLTVAPRYSVSLSVSPTGAGTVSGSGSYESGSSVTVTATPADGFEFVHWLKGNTVVSTSASYQFTITSSQSLTAVFEEKLKAYGTVDGTHRAISKAYAIVDGTVRQISKGYATVGGVWKKLF